MTTRRASGSLVPRSFTPWGLDASGKHHEVSVLVVDADAVTRRFVESVLAKTSQSPIIKVRVDSVRDVTAALERLQSSMFDLVIADTELAEMSGLRFLTLLRGEVRYQGVAFLFLTADQRAETKVKLLDAGADDVLEKPPDAAVLRAKVRSSVRRRRMLSPAMQGATAPFRGTFAVLALPDLVSILEASRRTGKLSIATRRTAGEIQFSDGTIWYASYGNLLGPSAFQALVVEPEGEYSFETMTPAADSRNIQGTATALILDAARMLDESGRETLPLPALEHERKATATAESSWRPPAELARQIEQQLSNELCLGEFRLWTLPQLESWSAATVKKERLHALIIAPLRTAVAAAMALSAPPSEELMLAALSAMSKTVGSSFYFARERGLDLVMCDMNDPEPTMKHLRRPPDIAVVYPAGGNYQNVTLRQRSLIDGLLLELRPTTLIGAGGAELRPTLEGLRIAQDASVQLGVVKNGSRADTLDLRSVMRSAVAIWGAGYS